MSKYKGTDEAFEPFESRTDNPPAGPDVPEGTGTPPETPAPEPVKADGITKPPETAPPVDPTIEELAARKKTPAPVFQAVIQAEGWGGGKRVPESVFEAAVKGFLSGAADGRKPVEKEEVTHGAA